MIVLLTKEHSIDQQSLHVTRCKRMRGETGGIVEFPRDQAKGVDPGPTHRCGEVHCELEPERCPERMAEHVLQFRLQDASGDHQAHLGAVFTPVDLGVSTRGEHGRLARAGYDRRREP
jgi:hypothetical protein